MSTTLYVSNVDRVTDLGIIEDLFTTVGDVMTQRIEHIPESGHQMEFGIFEMSTEQQAVECIERFNGKFINDRQLAITARRPKSRG